MGIEKEPKEEHEKEFADVKTLGEVNIKEFSGLKQRLGPKEKVKLFVGIKTKKEGGKRILAVTNKRLLSFSSRESKILGDKEKFKDIRIRDVKEVNVEERKGFDMLKVRSDDHSDKYMVPEGSGVKISGYIREEQEKSKGPAEKLETLSEQKDKGNITEEEFQDKKEELMEKI